RGRNSFRFIDWKRQQLKLLLDLKPNRLSPSKPSLQRSTCPPTPIVENAKLQTPSSREIPSSNLQARRALRRGFEIWNLEFLWCLVFVFWCFLPVGPGGPGANDPTNSDQRPNGHTDQHCVSVRRLHHQPIGPVSN